MFLVSCGLDKKEEKCDAKDKPYECPSETPVKSFAIQGSISSAFGVEVNDESYDDIEAFYTSVSANLDTLAVDLGLDGYTLKFDKVDLGFKDLTKGMDVFIQSTHKRGYAVKTTVSSDNTFKVSFPAEAKDDTYQIKAIKKISVIATKTETNDLGEEVITTQKLCWNFAAVDLNVDYSDVDAPVILSNFETKLTAKDCEIAKKSMLLQ